MREDTLRAVLMVKAIEETDRAGTLLPPGDRAQATREAVRTAGASGEVADAGDAFLVQALGERAGRLLGPLCNRFPIVEEALGRTRTPRWLLLVLLAAAFASGIGLSAMDGTRHINILALPFLGLIAWNLVVYVLLAAAWVKARTASPAPSPRRGNVLARLLERRVEPLLRTTRRVHAVLGEALGRYASSWASFGARVRSATRAALAAPRGGGRGLGVDRRPVRARHRAALRSGLGKHVSRTGGRARSAGRRVRPGGRLVGSGVAAVPGGGGAMSLDGSRRWL